MLIAADDLPRKRADQTFPEPVEGSKHPSPEPLEGPNRFEVADLCLLAGVDLAAAVAWLDGLADAAPQFRPRAVMTKTVDAAGELVRAAERAGVGLVRVSGSVRWERLLTTISSVLDHGPSRLTGAGSGDTDLFGLAQTVARLTRGMVSIEDDRAHVLAYSASDDSADELRRLSILGREGPVGYLRYLREQGVYDRLRQPGRMVDVAPDRELGIRRRLAIGIQPLPNLDEVNPGRGGPQPLGVIWVQEGQQPLAGESENVLRGAAAVAARLITRALNAPTNEAVQIQRLLGARGGGVDVPSLAAALSIPTSGPAIVIGFVTVGPAGGSVADASSTLRLHASAYSADSLVTTMNDRVYALLPRAATPARVPTWVTTVIDRMAKTGVSLRAAVAAPVSNLSDVPAARAEVDRVLDGTTADQRVTTLADSRTPVLLGEIFGLIAAHPELKDPRIELLTGYDERHGTELRVSVEAYLREFGDVRRAAAQLQVHPNTLRYRVRRAEEILGLDLTEPAARLLVELQLGMLHRPA
jgi:DNA-binding PucR family transcriptional regulator